MNYTEAMEYINSLKNRGIVPGMDNIMRLCAQLGNPQDKLKTIHIAGTNGKGSVGAFIASILNSAGFRVGRYVSPSVEEYCEICTINGEMMSQDDWASCISQVKEAANIIEAEGFMPTAFEAETAAAFLYFLSKNCDYAIIECGMGGRLDATNVITAPECSVITSISMDHSSFLGTTLSEIAFEKSGIIKQNCPVVSAKQPIEVMEVIKKKCDELNSPLFIAAECEILSCNIGGIDFMCSGIKLHTSLSGIYQADNAALAVSAVRCLGISISNEAVISGISNAKWKYRFEVINKKPLIIFDGAHNADGAKRLSQTLKEYFPDGGLNFVFGVFKDKDFEAIAKITAPLADMIYTVKPPTDRGLAANELAAVVGKYNKNVVATKSISEAARMCTEGECNAVVCFGSLSFLAQIKKEMGIN